MLIDGMAAANDLGLTDAVPARVVVRTDARIRPFHLGNLPSLQRDYQAMAGIIFSEVPSFDSVIAILSRLEK